MKIGGLEKLSLIDFPGMLSAIVFTQGCNFRCRFCYNPMLVWPRTGGKTLNKQEGQALISEPDLFVFLQDRIGKLDGVVITGGEPTMQADLPEFIGRIRDLGYRVKLDTNGTNPAMLGRLLEAGLLDYVAMDIKATPDNYQKIVGRPVDWTMLAESIRLIMESGTDYEFRTTVAPSLHSREDILELAEVLNGAKRWYLQALIADTEMIDPAFRGSKAYGREELESIAREAAMIAGFCQVRGFR